MELKTLKDLETLKYRKIIKFPSNYIKKSELKAEAIKWVKYARSFKVEPKEEQWFAFFNITEEDLK